MITKIIYTILYIYIHTPFWLCTHLYPMYLIHLMFFFRFWLPCPGWAEVPLARLCPWPSAGGAILWGCNLIRMGQEYYWQNGIRILLAVYNIYTNKIPTRCFIALSQTQGNTAYMFSSEEPDHESCTFLEIPSSETTPGQHGQHIGASRDVLQIV